MRAVVPGDLKLTAVRDNGQWEAWLRFFLEGVLETATEATKTAQHIHELREADRRRVPEAGGGAHELELLDRSSLSRWSTAHGSPRTSAFHRQPPARCSAALAPLGVLREVTGAKRDRIWRYDSYVDLFDEVTGQVEQDATLSGNVHGPVAQVHK